jgi:uncharacterized iron-regulated protein
MSLLELRIKIIKGEVKEKLCFIDSKDVAHIFDELGVLDTYSEEYKQTDLLRELLKEQIKRM